MIGQLRIVGMDIQYTNHFAINILNTNVLLIKTK